MSGRRFRGAPRPMTLDRAARASAQAAVKTLEQRKRLLTGAQTPQPGIGVDSDRGAPNPASAQTWNGLSLGYLQRFLAALQRHTFYDYGPAWGPDRARKTPEHAVPLAEVTTQEAVLQCEALRSM